HVELNPAVQDHEVNPTPLDVPSLALNLLVELLEHLGRHSSFWFDDSLTLVFQPDLMLPEMLAVEGLQVHALVFAREPTPVVTSRHVAQDHGHVASVPPSNRFRNLSCFRHHNIILNS